MRTRSDRFRGSIPPPGTDFCAGQTRSSRSGVWNAFSIAVWNDRVIFANAKGIFMTDGAGWSDLTARAGNEARIFRRRWDVCIRRRGGLSGFVYRNSYFLSINNGNIAHRLLPGRLEVRGDHQVEQRSRELRHPRSRLGARRSAYIGLANGRPCREAL